MGTCYGTKIRNREINPKTGKLWQLKDVPDFWREMTSEWLTGGNE